jgi:hypothetical protein
MFRAFVINIEISTNQLISTSQKIKTQPLINSLARMVIKAQSNERVIGLIDHLILRGIAIL